MAIGELSLTRRSLPALMLGLGLGLRGAIRAATPEATPDDAPDPMWRELAPIPLARSELGVAVIGTDIYIVGGFGGGDRVDRFDTVTGTWHHVADLPVAVHHPGATALDGRIYVAGGYLIEDSTAIADVWSYDPEADAWERRTSLSTPRGAFGLVAHNGALFAVGGAFEQLGGPATGLVERYDPGADLWVERTSLPTPREHLAVIASEDRIFAIGGRANGDESDAIAGANEVYDPATNRWETLPPLPVPRGGLSGVFADGQAIVLGGERGDQLFADVNAFDPDTGEWRSLPPMPTARHGLAAAVVGGTLYAITGSTLAGRVDNTPVVEALTLPKESAAT